MRRKPCQRYSRGHVMLLVPGTAAPAAAASSCCCSMCATSLCRSRACAMQSCSCAVVLSGWPPSFCIPTQTDHRYL